jgi:hypothetical protein
MTPFAVGRRSPQSPSRGRFVATIPVAAFRPFTDISTDIVLSVEIQITRPS